MDAKRIANFINSVNSRFNKTCPECGAVNEDDSDFCIYCGAKITSDQSAADNTPAFAPVEETAAPAFAPVEETAAPAFAPVEETAAPAFAPAEETAAPAFAPVEETAAPAFAPVEKTAAPAKETVIPAKAFKYVEPNNVFAQGLPAWSIEPPQVMVRRR